MSAMNSKKQAFWFLIVGSLAGLVHFVSLVICVELFVIQPIWANVIAFLIAFIVSFFGHFQLTFHQQTDKRAWQHHLQKWFISSVMGFLLNQGLFLLGLKLLGNAWYGVIWFIVTAMVTVMTFILGKLWAFKI